MLVSSSGVCFQTDTHRLHCSHAFTNFLASLSIVIQ